ncbi:error-prone DNA polymerase [Aestuariispira ectoiniformans]|uniref:error-prone DNA polymerase n=1 Tax=Aestuariispira ectoiniformans TaxID=2775080 RepID=UPI00223A8884|nr:error-prone DNA polymerase [Aestuariispira ectoiniformans]
MRDYVELQTTSNFSFLRGASHAEELVLAAKIQELHGLGLTDRNSFAGVVRAHITAKDHGLPYYPGVRLDLQDAPSLLCYPTDRAAYGRLCRLLTVGKRRAPKGECEIYLEDVAAHAEGSLFIAVQPICPEAGFGKKLHILKEAFGDRLWLSINRHYDGFDDARLAFTEKAEKELGVPAVATNDVHIHEAARKPLLDVVTCIREGCTLDEAGFRLFPNAERHVKSGAKMAALFPGHPEWLDRTLEIAGQLRFTLDELRYEYPNEGLDGETANERLNRLAWAGAQNRYPEGVPDKVRHALTQELELVGRVAYEPYFLTVHDIVAFAKGEKILCQGRGSAANSVICYCLGITEVDPAKHKLLFARFISEERKEPPDIDVDFEHERREEVIQHIYNRYGRERAGLTATVITYRSRSAVREVGKVFGLSEDSLTKLAKTVWGSGSKGVDPGHVQEAGLRPDEPRVEAVLGLSEQLIGFPRHLSQHVGGFVITQGPLVELSPVANAAMRDRTTIEWDKDDIDALGILKVDVLALGMLTCMRKSFALLQAHKRRPMDLTSFRAANDESTYKMLQKADSIGVFQVESRAQMSMLPRLKPKEFYDLVVEVAIVRPGPIQGGMVHPYLRRRQGLERVSYPSEELKSVLARTCGVPLFQEQAMEIAMVAAGYTASEADQLRRAMATFKRTGQIGNHRDKFISGMLANGYDEDFAERCFRQIEGFADYGFPESHSASFALLVYASAWMKCHHPDVFVCALLNSQPMGFYAPAQLVRDAYNHGVPVRPIDVNYSQWDNSLEDPPPRGYHALRLGFRQIKGFSEHDALAIAINRPPGGYQDLYLMARQTGLSPYALEKLAEADAFGSLGMSRRDALWAVKRFGSGRKAPPALPLFDAAVNRTHNMAVSAEFGPEDAVVLPEMSQAEEVIEDYTTLRLSLRSHPVALTRDWLNQANVRRAIDLPKLEDGIKATHAGLVIVRQRPGTASGVVFLTMEDETGLANIVVWSKVFEKYRSVLMTAPMIGVTGKLQREDRVTHLVAEKIVDLTPLLNRLSGDSNLETRPMRHPRNFSITAKRRSKEETISLDRLTEELSVSGKSRPNRLKVDSHDFH